MLPPATLIRHTPSSPPRSSVPQHIANQLLLRTRERELLLDNDTLGEIEELLDVVRAPEGSGGDQLPAGDNGGKLLGPGQRMKRRCAPIAAALQLLVGDDANDSIGGWTAADLAAACSSGRVKVFSRATLGAGSGEVFSVAHRRQRTRNSNHVKVRWEAADGADLPFICAVEYYVLVAPLARAGPAGTAAGGGGSGSGSGSGTPSPSTTLGARRRFRWCSPYETWRSGCAACWWTPPLPRT